MYDLTTFRERVYALYRSVPPMRDGSKPTQDELAQAVGLTRSELSRRLHGKRKLTVENAQALVRQLARWQALQTQAEALELLRLVDCPPFSDEEWRRDPLNQLAPLNPTTAPQPGSGRSNLPASFSSFLGRSDELTECARLLAGTRLLTITGAGGIGKTRLTIELGRRLLPSFADGVFMVALAPLTNGATIGAALARNLGLREEPGRALLDTISDYLSAKNLLLILDNCEHLLAAVTEVAATLLARCSRLRLVTTSRERLGLAGEVNYRLPLLAVPPDERVSVEQAREYAAVRLFVERAQGALSSFHLSARNVAAVATICRQLDGIALAIELAAAQVDALDVGYIAHHLDDRLRLLRSRDPNAPPRQQTLRASIAWSYDLLGAAERQLLRRLAVFAGGWELEAMAAVCADVGMSEQVQATGIDEGGAEEPRRPHNQSNLQSTIYNLRSDEVLGAQIQLVGKSLVQASHDEEQTRYTMLETIREYAHEQLTASGEAEVIQRQHAHFYLNLAETAEPELRGANQADWLARLEAEHDNLRAALNYSISHREIEIAQRLVGAMSWFWHIRGYLAEGRAAVAAVLGESSETPPAIRAATLNAAGALAFGQGDYQASYQFNQDALSLYRQLQDLRGVASLLIDLGLIAYQQGDYQGARALYQESMVIVEGLDDRWGSARVLENLGDVAVRERDYAAAGALYEQAISIVRGLGDRSFLANLLCSLALVHYQQSDYETARQLSEESLNLCTEIGHQWVISNALYVLGLVAQAQGNYEKAHKHHKDSLTIQGELLDKRGIAYSLIMLAHLAIEEDSLLATTRAVRLLSYSSALFGSLNAPMNPIFLAVYDHDLTSCRAKLAETAFATTWATGQAMSLAQAVAYALEEGG